MPDPGAPKRGSATRARLLAAALDLFVTRGYHATTTAVLAERTGIAEGTIYRHFRGKDALYNAVARQAWEQGAALITEEPPVRMPAADRLAGAARRLVREAVRAPMTVRFAFGAIERERLDEPARRAAERFREAIEQLIATGKQEGVVRLGTAELWAAVWTALVAFVCDRVARGEWSPEHPNVELALDAAWDAIAAGGDR
jgi:AcrR family transcriptional regulator